MALAFELHPSPSANTSGQGARSPAPLGPLIDPLRYPPSPGGSGSHFADPARPHLRRATAIVAAGVVGFVALTSLAAPWVAP